MYRKTRRNRSKDEFSKYIGVKQIWMNENIDSFRFMNTGDIIWLNTYKNLKEQYAKKGVTGLKKKFLNLFLTSALTLSLLAGCGDTAASDNGNKNT